LIPAETEPLAKRAVDVLNARITWRDANVKYQQDRKHAGKFLLIDTAPYAVCSCAELAWAAHALQRSPGGEGREDLGRVLSGTQHLVSITWQNAIGVWQAGKTNLDLAQQQWLTTVGFITGGTPSRLGSRRTTRG
jgi:hypothetical protein